MADHFPDYDVLSKRDTPSWNARTRRVIDNRLALSDGVDILSPGQRATLRAVADRVVPQPEGRPAVNTVAILLEKIGRDASDGFRPVGLPRLREAWERGLDAIEGEAFARHSTSTANLDDDDLDALLGGIERGDTISDWHALDPKLFWRWRLVPDLVSAYWAHPSAWSAMGFGGPASPRGYVRLDANQRDPWEATERSDSSSVALRRRNLNVI
jgi:hypothetical protein